MYLLYASKEVLILRINFVTCHPKKIFMVAIFNNKMASIYRDYSPFYNSVFSVIAEDRLSILFVSCIVTSIECNVSR